MCSANTFIVIFAVRTIHVVNYGSNDVQPADII